MAPSSEEDDSSDEDSLELSLISIVFCFVNWAAIFFRSDRGATAAGGAEAAAGFDTVECSKRVF